MRRKSQEIVLRKSHQRAGPGGSERGDRARVPVRGKGKREGACACPRGEGTGPLHARPRRATWAGCGREEEWATSGENGVAFGPEQREGVFSFFFYFVSFYFKVFSEQFKINQKTF